MVDKHDHVSHGPADHDHASAAPGHEKHDHDEHDHGAGHSHAPAGFGLAFAIGITLNTGFVALEAVYGVIANSTALLADAGHNLGDVLGLVLAWLASRLALARPSARYSYGLGASSILAALINALILMLATGAIAWEAVQRLMAPEAVAGPTVMAVATIGILVNGVTAWLFARGASEDLNIRGAFLHMAADAAVSAGVVAAAFLIALTGWLWLDPVTSLAICAVIVASTWALMRDSVSMALAGTPNRIDPDRVRALLLAQPGVTGLHDLHIWPISTTQTALTCHLVMPLRPESDAFLHEVGQALSSRFRIGHPTIQIETSPDNLCRLAPDEVI